MSIQFTSPEEIMRHAVELATRGIGSVEPNPAVGAVLVDDQLRLLGAGYHQAFGGAHAEINALADFATRFPDSAERQRLLETATLFVTLEPCCHQGKTPPCSRHLIEAGIRRVVVALTDPFPSVSGGGIRELFGAGIDIRVGLLETEVAKLNAPFIKLVTTRRPYVHAKWAMTLDGKLATRTGDSQWISNEESRAVVHQLRGRMDAIICGVGTAFADNPLLTARPTGPRVATRVVLDSLATLPLDSQLVQTAKTVPLLVVVSPDAPAENTSALRNLGAEVLTLGERKNSDDDLSVGRPSVLALMEELGKRSMSNVFIEGGSEVLGAFADANLIDEAHVFIAPKLIGGREAISPVGGLGADAMSLAQRLSDVEVRVLGGDVYLHGRVGVTESAGA